jgi:hypothetical protein
MSLLVFGIAVVIGFNVIGALSGFVIDLSVFPYYFPLIIAFNVIIVVGIIVIISLIVDTGKGVTERTTLEAVFGAGIEGFKPKGRIDAAAETVFGFVWPLILLLPPVIAAIKPAILIPLVLAAFLLLIGTVKGTLFYKYGENNANLLFEALLGIAWIIIALFLIQVPYPMDIIYYNSNGVWMQMTVEELVALVSIDAFDITIVFAIGWSIFVFILVVTNVWKTLVGFVKIGLYLREDKGWWWQGSWGTPKYKRNRWYRRFFSRFDAPSEEETTYTDGYTDNE